MKCDIFCEGVKEWIDSRYDGKYFFEYQDYPDFPTDPVIKMLLESPEHKVYVHCFIYKEEIERNDDPLTIQAFANALLIDLEEKIYLTFYEPAT